MAQENKKRSRRIPLTPEEVRAVIEFRRRKEQIQLLNLKKTRSYKLRNIFNVFCFFIFCELIFCYLGPCNYFTHYTTLVNAGHGTEHLANGRHRLEELDIVCAEGEVYKVLVADFVPVPPKYSKLKIGKDFLLGRNLKAVIEGSEDEYRLFSASPILILSLLTSVVLVLAISYNLNENEYTLWGLTTVSGMTMLCVVLM